ncbi:hypothetical protein Dda_5749 [Drechslerella dactyloides]|uniref:Uncharacterized protein n=1 Tax=Drechslerella dactyloides TaxID=74499 RepID=A0AAD6IUC6_DREDA|nr:hypothetical protein Dda_5749 [Drechslerella dactyloides]
MPRPRRTPHGPSSHSASSSTSTSSSSKPKGNVNSNANASPAGRKDAPTTPSPAVLRQLSAILTVFHDTFAPLFTPALPAIIQDVKQALYQRDYVAAFDSPQKLQAYAARWSVARALAYFDMIAGHWWSTDVTQRFTQRSSSPLNVTCIGGGAGAELVGIAAAFSLFASKPGEESENDRPDAPRLDITLLDFAAWNPIVESLYGTLTDEHSTRQPQLYLPKSTFSVVCHQQDILSTLSDVTVSSLASADIVTILFTAGELYSQSPTAATKLFVSLHAVTKPGALLVVVDSAGGFEELDVLKKSGEASSSSSIGGYKLGFLLDKTLTSRDRWETVASDDSRWWRVPPQLKDGAAYPLDLENMRCLVRVYRRSDDPD